MSVLRHVGPTEWQDVITKRHHFRAFVVDFESAQASKLKPTRNYSNYSRIISGILRPFWCKLVIFSCALNFALTNYRSSAGGLIEKRMPNRVSLILKGLRKQPRCLSSLRGWTNQRSMWRNWNSWRGANTWLTFFAIHTGICFISLDERTGKFHKSAGELIFIKSHW